MVLIAQPPCSMAFRLVWWVMLSAHGVPKRNAELESLSPLKGTYNPGNGTTVGTFESGTNEWYDVIYNALSRETFRQQMFNDGVNRPAALLNGFQVGVVGDAFRPRGACLHSKAPITRVTAPPSVPLNPVPTNGMTSFITTC
jgi:hypothetical protein